MAYHYFRFSTLAQQTFREYNIDYSVGLGGRNARDDVMLVQKLLHILYHEIDSPKIKALFPPPMGTEEIGVDGICGPITSRYILYYKNQRRSRGNDLYPDSVFDPFRNNDPGSLTTIHKTRYAFGLLTANVGKICDELALDNYDSVPESTETPQPLKSTLKQTRKQALKYGG